MSLPWSRGLIAAAWLLAALTVQAQEPELMVVGESEKVVLYPDGFILPARIDTGAETSSLNAREIEPFERDGKNWVRFKIEDGEENQHKYELPVTRVSKIKRHGEESQKRLVVEMKISLGEKQLKREFTLADRSKFKFPVLIGRNVLMNEMMVDVAQKNTAKPVINKPEVEMVPPAERDGDKTKTEIQY